MGQKKIRVMTLTEDRSCRACLFILLCSFTFKMFYAYRVGYQISPHDLGRLSDGINLQYGHLGYIQYLYQYGRFPGVELGELRSQFYHPPLFHIVGAIVLRFFSHGGEALEAAFEVLQYVNMGFAFLGTVYLYRIFDRLGFCGWEKIVLTLLAVSTPAFFIIGAELNNDCLMTMFCLMTLYYTICWMQEERWSQILKIALTISLAMLSKTSGGMIAPAIGVVFLHHLITSPVANRMKLVKQYVAFGLLCIPLGLSWVTRCKILFDMPFSYVLRLGQDSAQYVGNCSMLQRIGVPSFSQLTGYRIDWDHPREFANIWGETFLTMNFDEGILNIRGIFGSIAAVLVLWLSVVIYLINLVKMIKSIFIKEIPVTYRLLFPLTYFTLMGGYCSFCFQYPHICTMNFRYIVVTWCVLMVCGGLYDKVQYAGNSRVIGKTVMIIYSVLSLVLYMVYA